MTANKATENSSNENSCDDYPSESSLPYYSDKYDSELVLREDDERGHSFQSTPLSLLDKYYIIFQRRQKQKKNIEPKKQTNYPENQEKPASSPSACGPPCYCRLKCQEKLKSRRRARIRRTFLKLGAKQRLQYVALCVIETPKRRSRPRLQPLGSERRQKTLTYILQDGERGRAQRVCKAMFLSTLGVSEKFVRGVVARRRTSGLGMLVNGSAETMPGDVSGKRYLDVRLNCTNMYKMYLQCCETRGLPRAYNVGLNYYRELFKSEFNLDFKSRLPKQ
ncbi:uncharacterized protein LOC106652992 [Trichogramma pretiosum]|uniref:uncharacterized protein LOC106652992 n=1 Tax=Trichogramma pretiosum TaxID=7493 RepID=UPI0006C9E2C3|nr:uncharacterized protein LOC106652992 [Trichogramma pretiosum]